MSLSYDIGSFDSLTWYLLPYRHDIDSVHQRHRLQATKCTNGPLETILCIQQQCCKTFHSMNIQWKYIMMLYFAERI